MVYVLELENGKWYVGYTRSKSRRINDHFAGYGSKWTKKHKPIRVVEKIKGGREVEKKKTLQYMREFGVENVRGHNWCMDELKQPPTALANPHGKRLGVPGQRPGGAEPKLPIGWGASEHLHWSQGGRD